MTTLPITASDAYKFSMAEAGAALRQETFYYSHRKGGWGGWHYMPIDVAEFFKKNTPVATSEDYAFLNKHGYDVGASARKAYASFDKVKVNAVPKGSWFYNKEPAFSISGPSAAASWPEPLALMLHFRIQVATAAIESSGTGNYEKFKYATCQAEKDIMVEMFDSLGFKVPEITVREGDYYRAVFERAQKLVQLVGDPNRLFEVGMRAVSCLEQHEVALHAIKEAGILRTSDTILAQKLGMIPVGTMGHEHPQRFGEDYGSYTGMRDRFPGFLFYLPDTYDAMSSGIPSALRVIAEQPDRDAGIRFDSEFNIRSQYLFTASRAREMGLLPRLALESGWDYKLTEEFENLRKMIDWPADRQAYGLGGYLVKPDWPHFGRDDVAANYKLCQTGSRATMKFGDEPNSGKQSIPGNPVIWRPHPFVAESGKPAGYIAQAGEEFAVHHNASLLSGSAAKGTLHPPRAPLPPVLSPETQGLIARCRADRREVIVTAVMRDSEDR